MNRNTSGRQSISRARLLLLAVLAVLFTGGSWSEALTAKCAQCNKLFRGRHVTSNGRAYCSQRCFHKTLPDCSECGKRLKGKYLVSDDDHKFCSQKCYETILPTCEICDKRLMSIKIIDGHNYCSHHASGPRCSDCHLPFASGFDLPDGRKICTTCNKTAIYEIDPAMQYYRRARREVQNITGRKVRHIPGLQIVGVDTLTRLLGNDSKHIQGLNIHGFYKRNERTTCTRNVFGKITNSETDVTKRIYIAYGLGPESFMATAVHEFTHDIIADNFPHVTDLPLWVQEGICQYTAAIFCRHYGYTDERAAIEESPDKVYGDGYRYFKKVFRDTSDWRIVSAWMRKSRGCQLPAIAPK